MLRASSSRAGFRKWKGKLLDVDLPKLRGELETSRDAIFAATQIKPDLFRSN
jgi:hypothetical protein